MEPLSRDELAQMVAAGKTRLLTAYNFSCDASAGECAARLTEYAIDTELIPWRRALKGASLVSWSKGDGTPNAWALTAAAELALLNGYTPRSADEWAAAAYCARDSVPTLARADMSLPDDLLEWKDRLIKVGLTADRK